MKKVVYLSLGLLLLGNVEVCEGSAMVAPSLSSYSGTDKIVRGIVDLEKWDMRKKQAAAFDEWMSAHAQLFTGLAVQTLIGFISNYVGLAASSASMIDLINAEAQAARAASLEGQAYTPMRTSAPDVFKKL
ncbi:MAG: hypothetical protein K6C34_04895, partial [Alphaproteobacteria bacterium]|nr:hypothetical protein [Alphaproteobacteria bacterium]